MPEQIPVVLRDLPTRIHGFICLGSDYNPCIVINSRLPIELQRQAYRHEMKHLVSGDMYNDDYVEYSI